MYRKKFVVYLDGVEREKSNGNKVYVGIHPSKVRITTLKIDSGRKEVLERRAMGRLVATGEKYYNPKIEATEVDRSLVLA